MNLMEWQSNTSVGLQQHNNDLMLSVNEAESLRVKIEELRRHNEATLAELTEVDRENKTLGESWIMVREGLGMFSSQVKVATAQLDLLKDEEEDIIKLENERKKQIQDLNDRFTSMSLRNSRNQAKVKEELSLLKVGVEKRRYQAKCDYDSLTNNVQLLEDELIQSQNITFQLHESQKHTGSRMQQDDETIKLIEAEIAELEFDTTLLRKKVAEKSMVQEGEINELEKTEVLLLEKKNELNDCEDK